MKRVIISVIGYNLKGRYFTWTNKWNISNIFSFKEIHFQNSWNSFSISRVSQYNEFRNAITECVALFAGKKLHTFSRNVYDILQYLLQFTFITVCNNNNNWLISTHPKRKDFNWIVFIRVYGWIDMDIFSASIITNSFCQFVVIRSVCTVHDIDIYIHIYETSIINFFFHLIGASKLSITVKTVNKICFFTKNM